MPGHERLPRFPRGCRRAHIGTAHFERLSQQCARIGVVVDDQKLEVRARQRTHVGGPAFLNRERRMKDARNPLQDSGLTDSRLVAGLLQAGMLVLGESGELRFASEKACDLFGAESEAGLRASWG